MTIYYSELVFDLQMCIISATILRLAIHFTMFSY